MATVDAASPTHHYGLINGIRLHWVEAGAGPLVVLLHGFPEFWYSWRHQIAALSAAGFRVLAPDLRGYNESAKPAGVASYRLELLAADVLGLIRHAGPERAIVVGHDWGGGLAWHLAIHHPQAVEKLAILNAPHPAAFARELRTWRQLRRSWYVFFFQLPWLPEWYIRRGNYAGLAEILTRDPVRPGTFSPQDIAAYRAALARPGALTSAINWYRALFRHHPRLSPCELRPIRVPTLVIWGEQDRYLGISLLDGLKRWAPDLVIERIADASHWVQNDAAERVNDLLISFSRPSGQP
jgi:pimeloyl-ACP methyl ester carboxylesterase